MGDFIIEFIQGFIRESMPYIFRGIGACIKWLFYLGKKSFKEIFKEEWNMRIGFLFAIIIILTLVIND